MKQLAVEQPIWGTLKAKEIEGMWTNSNTLYELTQKVSFLRSSRPSTPQEVNTLVSSIPATFAHFFDFLETRIGFMKRQILDWITYSVRPMTLSELAVCIALDEVQTITANDLRNYTPWEIQTYLEHSLGQIIKITGETVVIRHSLYEQQILSKPRSIENVHLLLLRKCINYLRAIEDSWKPEKEFERENRMAGYAALHWPEHYHCAVATSVEESCGSVLLLFESEKSLKAWLNVVSFHDRVSNEPIKLPQTAISSASRFGLTAVVERLLDSHQGEEDLESQCVAALETAAKYGHIGVIRLLVDRGVRSEQALVGAACFGDIATTTELLKTHKQFLDSRGGQEGAYTPILQAALLGHLDTFALLLAEGADVEALTPETKWSALHLSARIGQIAIVRLLVHKRASLGLSDYKGYTALAHAADAGFSDVVRELIKGNVSDILPEVAENQQSLFVNPQNDERDTPLHLAASHGHSQVVQILLQNGAKPQMRNKIGYTPLHLAVVGGFDDITKTLLGSGTQDLCSTVATNILPVQEIEDDYKVPSLLELAVESQNLDTIKTLRYSALPVNELLLSPALEMACRLASHECVLYLLEWHHDRSDVGESLTTKDGNTALHLAAQNGDSALFIELLETSFADIDIDNQEGNTPLAEAAISGSLPILQRFCNDPRLSGAMSDGTERTIFHLAAKSGHVHIVKWLMTFSEHKRDRVTDLEQTAVFIAAKNGHQCVVKFLLESKYSVASGALLHLVIQRGWVDVAKQIISTAETAVVNWRDLKTGKTALHLAIGTGRADLVQLLLELVADPNQKDEAGFVPFATAMKSDHLDIVRVFLDSSRDIYFDGSGSADVTPLLRACEEGPNKIPFLKELLEKQSSGVNMNAKWPVEDDSSHVGDTPLVLASLHLDTDWEGGYALLNLLLSFGSDPNVPDARGNTALFVAAELGHYKALKSLLDNRADPKIKNDRGSTALHRCSQSGYVECIEELLKHGALINAAKRPKDDQLSGITPLLIAVAQSEKAAVDKLLEHGAEIGRSVHVAAMTGEAEIAETLFQKLDDPNVYDGEFGTPLHAAVACSNDEMVKFILALRGIDVNITGPAGRTALGIAASITEGEDIVKYLVDAQADPNIRDHEGKTPLDHAIIEEETEIVKYLCDHTRLDLSEAGVRNHSPLYLACQTGKIDIFEVVNSASKSLGESEYRDLCELSLHATIAAGKPKFLDQLISQSGVMGNMEDDDGWTALKYATNYLQSEMKEQVLKKLKENELHENTQQTDQTVAKMPRAWHTKDRHPALYRQHESTTGEVMITTKLHEVQPAGEDDFAAVRADHCIPADEDYYFEVAIVKGHDKGGLYVSFEFAPIGFAPLKSSLTASGTWGLAFVTTLRQSTGC
ncbi:hypothetical protein H9Q74_000241 [Fusarium xylarioides]|nr:hypothetical protein H9Q71_001202 [Fusarium xylarioides]KAG5829722.1 hypothetical protein H9Q74_000241 [Fusarium xylarioides]